MKIYMARLSIALLLGYLSTFTSIANAADLFNSDKIGSGGDGFQSLLCLNGKAMTGLEVSFDSYFIYRTRVRCTSYTANGDWTGSHSWTQWSERDGPLLSPQAPPDAALETALCPQNKWVGKLMGYEDTAMRIEAIEKLKVMCFERDAQGALISGTGSWDSAGVSSELSSGWKSCPNNGVAFGIDGQSGWYLDQIWLKCGDSWPPVLTGITLNPSALYSGELFTVELTFSNTMTANQVRLETDKPLIVPLDEWYGLGGDTTYQLGSFATEIVNQPTAVIVKATYDGVVKTATLTVNPPLDSDEPKQQYDLSTISEVSEFLRRAGNIPQTHRVEGKSCEMYMDTPSRTFVDDRNSNDPNDLVADTVMDQGICHATGGSACECILMRDTIFAPGWRTVEARLKSRNVEYCQWSRSAPGERDNVPMLAFSLKRAPGFLPETWAWCWIEKLVLEGPVGQDVWDALDTSSGR